MDFIDSVGTSEAIDGRLKVVLSRMEPGSGEDDFEAQLRIEHPGGVEYFGLPGKWVTRPERYVMMDLGRGNNVDRILHMKDGLSEHSTDIEFLRDIAKAITGVFTVNVGLMYDTTYLLVVPRRWQATAVCRVFQKRHIRLMAIASWLASSSRRIGSKIWSMSDVSRPPDQRH